MTRPDLDATGGARSRLPQRTPVDALVENQNPDGGWPYTTGASWTEPTVYAILATLAAGHTAVATQGIEWLRGLQRGDGGFAPQVGVEESTWVTALVAILPPERLGPDRHRSALQWLMRQTGRESTRTYRLRQWMLGISTPPEQRHDGWPWFPGAAAWVSPTSLALLALGRAHVRQPDPQLKERIDEGRLFLASRMCKDGGWNHGSARALGYDGRPYPETTGMALSALAGAALDGTDRALQQARRFLASERSLDARNWLTLGLLAHRERPPVPAANPFTCRTVRDRALSLLVEEAEKGRNWILAI